jgi:hypothetical protein
MIGCPLILNLNFTHFSMVLSKSTKTYLLTYLLTVPVSSKGQTNSIYLESSQAFDKVNHTLLLHKLSNSGLSDHYINWIQSYLSSRFSVVCTLGKSLSPSPMLPGVPQSPTLGRLLFNTFIKDLCAKIHFPEFLLLANDLKILCVIKSADDRILLQSDTDSVQKW